MSITPERIAEIEVEALSRLGNPRRDRYTREILSICALARQALDVKARIMEEISGQEVHYGQVAAAASAGSKLHAGEADCTEGVIKGLEYALGLFDAPTPPTKEPA
jgi:hypothetical protein